MIKDVGEFVGCLSAASLSQTDWERVNSVGGWEKKEQEEVREEEAAGSGTRTPVACRVS